MTDKSATPGWHKADARELEPYFSKWMLELTAQGLHNKSDIAIVLSILDAELATAKAELEKCREALRGYVMSMESGNPDLVEHADKQARAALGESK